MTWLRAFALTLILALGLGASPVLAEAAPVSDAQPDDANGPAVTATGAPAVQRLTLADEQHLGSAYLDWACSADGPVSLDVAITSAGSETVRHWPSRSVNRCAGGSPVLFDTWDGADDDGHRVPDGTYTVTATVTDHEGETGEGSVTVVVDSTVPARLVSPTAGGRYSTTMDVVVEGTDGRQLESAYVFPDNCETWYGFEPANRLSGSIDVRTCPVGEQSLEWGATWIDELGAQHSFVGRRAVTFDDVSAPTLEPTAWDPPETVARTSPDSVSPTHLRFDCGDGSPLTLTLVVEDADGAEVRRFDQEANCAGAVGSRWVSVTWDGQDDSGHLVPDGRYRAHAQVTDPAGRQASADVDVDVDTRAPLAIEDVTSSTTTDQGLDLVVRPAAGFDVRRVSAAVETSGGSEGAVESPKAGQAYTIHAGVGYACEAGAQVVGVSTTWTDSNGHQHVYASEAPFTLKPSANPPEIKVYGAEGQYVTKASNSSTYAAIWGVSCTSTGPVTFGLVIKDEDGKVVHDAGEFSWSCGGLVQSEARYFAWQGQTDDGGTASNGRYHGVGVLTDAQGLTTTVDLPVTVNLSTPATMLTPDNRQQVSGSVPVDVEPTAEFSDRVVSAAVELQVGPYPYGEAGPTGGIWKTYALERSDDGHWRAELPLDGLPAGSANLPWHVTWTDDDGGTHWYSGDARALTIVEPSTDPTPDPTPDPTTDPTTDPTPDPTLAPTTDPTPEPTTDPTTDPTPEPTTDPTTDPTPEPTTDPTTDPTPEPTTDPTTDPTPEPTTDPTTDPTPAPTTDPTPEPTPDPAEDGPTLGVVTVSGLPVVDGLLTAKATDVPDGVDLAYRWERDGLGLPDATAATYSPRPRDVGHALRVRVTGSRKGADDVTSTSESVVVQRGTLAAPVPTLTGTARVGRTLRVDTTGWGPSPVGFTYRWYADGVLVRRATRSAYVPTLRDVGARITVTVTGRKAGYTSAQQTSKPTARVRS